MSDEGKSLGMPIEIARRNLLEDPSIRTIAEELGVPLEVYVDKVLEYARHPEREPELAIIEDADAREMGVEVATEADVVGWFEGLADGSVVLPDARKEVASRDGFTLDATEAERLRAEAQGRPRRAPAPAPAPPPNPEAGAVLKQQLAERQRQMQLSMEARKAGKPPAKKP